MNLPILPPAMGKVVGLTGLFGLGIATGLGKGNILNSNLFNFAFKIDLLSNHARAEGFGKTYNKSEVKTRKIQRIINAIKHPNEKEAPFTTTSIRIGFVVIRGNERLCVFNMIYYMFDLMKGLI